MELLKSITDALDNVSNFINDKLDDARDFFVPSNKDIQSDVNKSQKLFDELINDTNKGKGFFNNLDDYIGAGLSLVGIKGYGESVNRENKIEDVNNIQLPEQLKASGISPVDIYKFSKLELNDINKKQLIEENRDKINFNDIVPVIDEFKQQGEDIDWLFNKYGQKQKYDDFINKGPLGDTLIKLKNNNILDSEQVNELADILKDFHNKAFELEYSIRDAIKDKDSKNKALNFLNKYKEKEKEYLNLVNKKINELISEGETKDLLNKVANDKKLKDKARELDNLLQKARGVAAVAGTVDKAKQGDIFGTFKNAAGVIGSAIQEGINMVTNNVSRIPNIEAGLPLQERIDQPQEGVVTKMFDKLGSVLADITPAIIGLLAGGAIAAPTKTSLLANTSKFLLGNEIINGIFNHYFDPAESKWTQTHDALFDILGETVIGPVIEESIKQLDNILTNKGIDKYIGDKTIKIGNEEVKLKDILKDDDINTLIKTKGINDAKVISDIFDKKIKLLEDLNKKKSGLFSPLLTKVKKSIIKDVIEYASNNGNEKLANTLSTLSRSSKGLDKVFDLITQSYKEYKNELGKLLTNQNLLNKQQLFIDDAIKLTSIKEGLLKKITNDIQPTEEGNIIKVANSNGLPTADEINFINNAKRGLFDDKAYIGLIDDLLSNLNKSKKTLSYEEFVDYVKQYFNNIKTKLPDNVSKRLDELNDTLSKTLYNDTFKNTKIKLINNKTKFFGQTNNIKNTVVINTLKHLYNNPDEFFIVLFHELSHRNGVEFFKQMLSDKELKSFEKVYKDIINGLMVLKGAVDNKTAKEIDELLQRFNSEEEFFAYIAGDAIVKGKTSLLNRYIDILEKAGITFNKTDIETLKQSLQKYIDNRFFKGLDKKNIGGIFKFAKNIPDIIKKGNQVLKKYFSNVLMRRDILSVDNMINDMDNTELYDFIKTLFGKKQADYVFNLGVDDKTLRDIIKQNIRLNLSGEQGFKSAALFEWLNRLVTNKIKGTNYDTSFIYKILGKDKTLEEIEYTIKMLDTNKGLYELYKDLTKQVKLPKTLGEAITLMLKSLSDGKLDGVTLNTVSLIWGYLSAYKGLIPKLSRENLLSKSIKFVEKKVGPKTLYSTINSIIEPLGYKINKGSIRDFINSGFNILQGLKKGWISKVDKKIDDNAILDYIRANYGRFRHDVSYNLNKGIIENISNDTIKKEAEKINSSLYKIRKETVDEFSKIGKEFNISYKPYPGLPDNLGKEMVEKYGDGFKIVDNYGTTYIINKNGDVSIENTPITFINKLSMNVNRADKLDNNIKTLFSIKDRILTFLSKDLDC